MGQSSTDLMPLLWCCIVNYIILNKSLFLCWFWNFIIFTLMWQLSTIVFSIQFSLYHSFVEQLGTGEFKSAGAHRNSNQFSPGNLSTHLLCFYCNFIHFKYSFNSLLKKTTDIISTTLSQCVPNPQLTLHKVFFVVILVVLPIIIQCQQAVEAWPQETFSITPNI